ncbi:hypothetical protein CTEN210_13807 [Chaetoceros tenuissimus]|uniref:J domain-containing protein n=1 Tax=Chaetoceros tenuissimus TaxID=426638 RepID=A0AAD3HBM5_9STRA|nr:hypothetical protein CTEN210_13807 [Chaetoceros tenuissimus]
MFCMNKKTLIYTLAFLLLIALLNDRSSAQDVNVDQEVEDEFLAEILAEEQREAEEMAKLEAEMRELEELKAQHAKMHQNQQSQKMKPGMNGNRSSMSGANSGGKSNLNDVEEELRKKEAAKAEAERIERQAAIDEEEKKKAAKLAEEREAKYQAELERIKDENMRKKLQRQKRRDGQIVKRILRNSINERHYAVLGLKCKWGEISFGPFKFCSVSPAEVKRAYRTRAREVHPDKNRDGRANEAFDALERSASLLMDPSKKKKYDMILAHQRKVVLGKAFDTLENGWKAVRTVFKLLGPFATPIAILLALII